MVGLSYASWMSQHTRRHVSPNHEDDDPDIHIPAIAFTAEQAQERRGFSRWMAKYQVFLVLSPLTAVAFILVHQCLWGVYMGCSFAPGHKGMPTIAPGQKIDFLRRQVLTSRNVRGGRWVDFTLGALNYQVEHHLFPSMPRPNLRRAQPVVRAFCARKEIEYSQCGWMRTHWYGLQHLHAVGAPLRLADH